MPRKAEYVPGIEGKRITSLRKQRELTQQELADRMNARGLTISAGLIKLMEAGRATVTESTIEKYAAFFQCTPEYIRGTDSSPYTGFLRALTSDTVKEQLLFESGLRALIHRSVSPVRIGTLAAGGKLDEEDLYRRAYEHMIQFVEAELRKTEEDAGDLSPVGMTAIVQQIGSTQRALDQFRTGRLQRARDLSEKIQAARENARKKDQE